MPRETLTRARIVDAAVDLLDAEGLEGLNMRALGTRLSSAATAVYWHVGSKEHLLELAADQAWREITLPDVTTPTWRAAALSIATSLHDMLTRHPWLVLAFGSQPLYGPAKARHDDHSLAIFETAGFPPSKADRAAATVVTFVLGSALGTAATAALARRQRHDPDSGGQLDEHLAAAREIASQFPRLRQRLHDTRPTSYGDAGEGTFESGLHTILDGLQLQLDSLRADTRHTTDRIGDAGSPAQGSTQVHRPGSRRPS